MPQKRFKCEKCGKDYAYKSGLAAHMKKSHGLVVAMAPGGARAGVVRGARGGRGARAVQGPCRTAR